jgi:hypothetical protein
MGEDEELTDGSGKPLAVSQNAGKPLPVSRESDKPLAVSQPPPFQYTLCTLLLVTLVVALFCSAASTFNGMILFLAVTTIAWATIAAVYWKNRVSLVVAFAHACGPVYGVVMLAVSAYRHSLWVEAWETLLAVGLTAGIVASLGIGCTLRLWRRA